MTALPEIPTPDEIRASAEYRALKAQGHTDSAIVQRLTDLAEDESEGPDTAEPKALDDMDRDELLTLAKDFKIKGRKGMTDAELFDAIASLEA